MERAEGQARLQRDRALGDADVGEPVAGPAGEGLGVAKRGAQRFLR
jgi:hypothetical protein